MNKKEFLDLLRYYLKTYPANIVNDIVSDYEEHFREGAENGKTEEEISKDLGSPHDIAEEFLNSGNSFLNDKMNFKEKVMPKFKDKSKISSGLATFLLICAAILLSPLILGAISVVIGLIFGAIGLVVAAAALIISIVIGGLALILDLFIPFELITGFSDFSLSFPTSILAGTSLICLGILFAYLFFKLIKLCIIGINKLYLSVKWNMGKWGTKNEDK